MVTLKSVFDKSELSQVGLVWQGADSLALCRDASLVHSLFPVDQGLRPKAYILEWEHSLVAYSLEVFSIISETKGMFEILNVLS